MSTLHDDEIRTIAESGRLGGVGELDAARLATTADKHLRLDDDGPAEFLRRLARFRRRGRQPPLRHGDADAGEELLSLVLVEIHGRARVYPSG